jgi:predicted ABC-type ATPase
MTKGRQFFVIAGPNGAGKTAFGKLFVPSELVIFNGDLVFADLVKQYPNVHPERLKGGVPVALEKARDKALVEQKDFAFETNFSTDLTLELIEYLQKKEYKINLIYFGLDTIDFAESRVKTRISLGGHDVPSETIKSNYIEGIKRVKENIGIFDSATFVDNNLSPTVVAQYQKNPSQYVLLENEVVWFNLYFRSFVGEMMGDRNYNG